MSSTVDLIAMLREHFPDQGEILEPYLPSDDSFRALCRDFRTCLATLNRLGRQKSPILGVRQREYALLLEELAEEIRRWPENRPVAAFRERDTDRETR